MTGRRMWLHAVFVTIAPVLVAWFGLSVTAAVLLVLLLLLWRLAFFSAAEQCRSSRCAALQSMQEDIERWSAGYPHAVQHVVTLYREQRARR